MRDLLGITGSPGTGKKTVAAIVGELLRTRPLALGDLAAKSTDGKEEGEVDVKEVRAELLKVDPPPSVIFGHLLPYVVTKAEVRTVFVLRCDPRVLKSRLAGRGYSARKVRDNVEAELIGVIQSDSIGTFGEAKVSELDTTSTPPRSTAEELVRRQGGASLARERIDWIRGYDSAEKLRSLLAT